jgi:hypothetical protein
MNGTKSIAIVVLMMSLTGTAPASIFGKKTAKVDPLQRVPQLLYTVKMEPDEKKRAAAAGELRDYDSKMFPEIVPILADVVQTDKSPSVRVEAIQSLGKIRPVNGTAGEALERAAKDSTTRVRFQARTSLRLYQLAGYRSGAKDVNEMKVEIVKSEVVKSEVTSEAKPVPAKSQPATSDQPPTRTIGRLLQLRGTTKSNPPPATTMPALDPLPEGAVPAAVRSTNNDTPRPLPSNPPFSTAIQPQTPRTTPPPTPFPPTTAEPPLR